MRRGGGGRLSRRQQHDLNTGLGCLALLIAGVAILDPRAFVALVVVLVIAIFFVVLINWRRKQARLQAEEEGRERLRQVQAEMQEEALQREAAKRRRISGGFIHPSA